MHKTGWVSYHFQPLHHPTSNQMMVNSLPWLSNQTPIMNIAGILSRLLLTPWEKILGLVSYNMHPKTHFGDRVTPAPSLALFSKGRMIPMPTPVFLCSTQPTPHPQPGFLIEPNPLFIPEGARCEGHALMPALPLVLWVGSQQHPVIPTSHKVQEVGGSY